MGGYWEGMEYVEESEQDYVFFKIDFDKAYDRLNRKYILESLDHMGCGSEFCRMVSTLFGHAIARMCVNGELTEVFKLTMSIRQG